MSKFKKDDPGAVQRFKARLVAKGYSQKAGIYYGETYSPVVKHDSLRVVLAVSAVMDLETLKLDVKTAFMNGDFEEEIYMGQPAGFIDLEQRSNVCRLNKSRSKTSLASVESKKFCFYILLNI